VDFNELDETLDAELGERLGRDGRRRGRKPLFASGTISAYGVEAPSKLPDPMIWALADGELIKSPKDGINVFDFEPVAHRNVPPAHFGYMASGIDDEVTFAREPRGVVEIPAPPAPSQPPANPRRYTA
jgi:hypothetical protein